MIVVGEVAAVDLAWFDRRPLFGTPSGRDPHAAAGLAAQRRAPRTPAPNRSRCPRSRSSTPRDGGTALAAAPVGSSEYDWVVVTSPNGAERLLAAAAGRPRVRHGPRGGDRAGHRAAALAGGQRQGRPRARRSSSPRRCSTRSPLRPGPGAARSGRGRARRPPRRPAATRAGRSTWSTPTAPCPPRSPTSSGAGSPRPTSSRSRRSSTVEHCRRRLRDRGPPARRRVHRPGHRGHRGPRPRRRRRGPGPHHRRARRRPRRAHRRGESIGSEPQDEAIGSACGTHDLGPARGTRPGA